MCGTTNIVNKIKYTILHQSKVCKNYQRQCKQDKPFSPCRCYYPTTLSCIDSPQLVGVDSFLKNCRVGRIRTCMIVATYYLSYSTVTIGNNIKLHGDSCLPPHRFGPLLYIFQRLPIPPLLYKRAVRLGSNKQNSNTMNTTKIELLLLSDDVKLQNSPHIPN